MIQIVKPGSDPFFNIAAEEYLVKASEDEVLLIWENTDCVVVGKHQNTFAEINYKFVKTHKIPVIRRISGGGTVAQGRGNINYSVILNHKNDQNKVDFHRFTKPITDFLQSIGVPATLQGKSNLTVHSLKFSGNAAHVFKQRSLHHGTILFDADLDFIEQLITVADEESFASKAIPSNRVNITNLRPQLLNDLDSDGFTDLLCDYLRNCFSIKEIRELTFNQLNEIQKLADEKYNTWEWNFGYSPDFRLSKQINTQHFNAGVQLSVHKGVISDMNVIHLTTKCNDFPDLTGVKFHENELYALLHEKLTLLPDPDKEINEIINQMLFR